MATGWPKSTDAAKAKGRGRPERWLFLTSRSLFYRTDGEPAPWACFKRGRLHGGVDR